MQSNSNRVESYLTPLLYHHIKRLRNDLQSKIQILEEEHSYRSAQYGGDKPRVEAAKATVASIDTFIKQPVDPKTEDDLRGMITDLKQFDSNIESLQNKIKSLDEESMFIDANRASSSQIESKYNHFLDQLAARYQPELSHLRNTENRSTFSQVDTSEVDFTGMLELFRPLIASYDLLRQKLADGTDITSVLNIIEEQSDLDIMALHEARTTIKNLMSKLESLSVTFNTLQYEKVGKNENSLAYRVSGETDKEYQIQLTTSAYEYMVELDLDANSSDSLKAIRLNDLNVIRDYLQNVGTIAPKQIIADFEPESVRRSIEVLDEIDRGMTGGGYNYLPHQTEVDHVISHESYQKLYDITGALVEINKTIVQIRRMIDTIKLNRERMNYYLMYLAQVGLMGDVEGMTIYRYINRGILDYYRSIIEDIFERINKLGPEKRPSKTHLTRENRKLVDAEYFRTYHLFMLQRMQNMIVFLVDNLALSDTIDLQRCTGPIFDDFVIFNHFKDILDSYYEEMQNKVSIYARINDYGTLGVDLPEEENRAFKKSENNRRMVSGRYSVCMEYTADAEKRELMRESTPLESKFNMVFDAEYPDNESISKYMSISTNISKKKGVMILTYGYSGTGKTFTLFGNAEKKGLLQSAIEGIRARSNIYFRAYELYGAGLVYPFYWCTSVTEKAYRYEVDGKVAKSDHLIDSLEEYVGIDDNEIPLNTYIEIQTDDTANFFSNFSDIVESIDDIRKAKGRIKKTPNNPESSRSIIIYDMLIMVEDREQRTGEKKGELVKLTVIDLPGREEIVTTYTDDYISKHPEFNTPLDKAILSSMAINPMYLAILCPNLVFEAFNALEGTRSGICKGILTQELSLEALENCMDGINRCLPRQAGETVDSEAGTILDDLIFVSKQKVAGRSVKKTVGDFIGTSGTPFNRNYTMFMTRNPHHNSENKISRPSMLDMKVWRNERHLGSDVNIVQYQAVIAIYLLNRVILMNDVDGVTKFDVLKTMYSYISRVLGYEGLSELALAPFEGIYINENIVGLMKTLTTNSDLLDKDQRVAEQFIPPHEFMSFFELKTKIRERNYDLYSKGGGNTIPFENIAIDIPTLERIYRENRDLYDSKRIFRFCNPEIEKVMNYYIQSQALAVPIGELPPDFRPKIRTVEDRDAIAEGVDIFIGPTKDVKVFYLFSNNKQSIKCEHQYKLYKNTQELMNIIDPINN